ncbi:cilia- and flagella-associated protein 99 [Myripristis murdjan]|uniref:cilia- and flagella-associated protein 99 n=1 Tax=Myripristis murdjan TaxID=586833 RepID=UPI001175EA46|nr:cilia- and flagella-associated protein 99 [Myripristis murdjan]
MASMYGSLVKEATVLLDQFSADKLCLDDFMENASKTLQNMDAPDRNFLLDVVSGCIEHKKLLDVVVNAFYAQNGKCLSRGDRSTFVIICYLATFTMDDLGLECFSKIVKSLDTKKMHKFLSFFFDVTNLTTWIQGEWSHIYDAAFVEKNWIAPLLRWRPEIDILMDQLAARMSSGSRAKKAPVKTTEPQEFCLTKPKPRPLPMPEPIPQQEKPKPVPKSTHRAPKEMHTIEEIKQKNRQKAQELLYLANTKQFECANPQKSEHTKKVMSEIKESFDSQLKFNSFQSSGVPASLKMNSSWPIKLNNTAIMRQEALYNRQVEEELRRMERLVEGAQEPSSFLQWQKQMRDQDLQEELAQLELRRLQGLISHKEAAMARTHIMERNQKAAQLQKEETAQLMQRYARKRLQEEKEMRDLVQQVADGHKNTKAAKQRLQELKQSIVKEVSEQSQELLRQALEEAQAELSRKFEIIREIHAIRSVPHMRHKFVDDTETGGHDLLGEMSLAELKERLAILKEAKQREQEERREWILEEKQSKQQLLLQQLDTIDIHRKALAQAAASRKEEKKARRGLQQAVAKDERVLALQKRLEEKQQEHLRLKQRESSKAKTSEQAAAHTVRSWKPLEV